MNFHTSMRLAVLLKLSVVVARFNAVGAGPASSLPPFRE